MNLTIHLGLAKTGTTTIQKLLSEEPCYLGKYDQREIQSPAKVFQNLVASDYKKFKDGIHGWAEMVKKAGEERSVNNLIISDENLLASRNIPARIPSEIKMDLSFCDLSRKVGFLTASHIKYLSEEVWTYGDVKVVLVLRNQAEWLISRYAQSASLIDNPSQSSFESWVESLLDHNCEYLDWSARVGNLREVLGERNVQVLLFEEIKSPEFWETLNNFLMLGSESSLCRSGFNIKPSNALKNDDGLWRLKSKQGEAKAIALTESFNLKVRHAVSSFNEKLQSQLSRNDLKSLGY